MTSCSSGVRDYTDIGAGVPIGIQTLLGEGEDSKEGEGDRKCFPHGEGERKVKGGERKTERRTGEESCQG